jgi:hypothetical protein
MQVKRFSEALLDRGLEPEHVARLARALDEEQRQIVHDLVKKAWRLAGLYVFANALELLESHPEARRVLADYEADWRANV